MKRSYPSGAEKRKTAENKRKAVSSLPKVSSFFRPAPATTAPVEAADPVPGTSRDASRTAGAEAIGESTDLSTATSDYDNDQIEEHEPDSHTSVRDDATIGTAREEVQLSFSETDPAYWPQHISSDQRVDIVRRGPVQIEDLDFPHSHTHRRFTKERYFMKMKNGEKIRRSWLVYSQSSDAVFCFCCTLFCKRNHSLTDRGFRMWERLTLTLQDHEKSNAHRSHMDSWRELEMRVKTHSAIDQTYQELQMLEKKHWSEVMKRLIAIVCHLAQKNLAFRGHNSNLHEPNNGNFLGIVELLAEFDPVMSEHVRRAENKEIADHYLGKTIQNELITLIGHKTVEAITDKIKKSNNFSVIMDCTPDAAHTEQLFVTLRSVQCDVGVGATVAEHFVGFLPVVDTSGAGLTDVFLGHMEKLGLDMEKCRGQAYDNGSNMRGKNSGVQKRLLDINKKALFMPCASHSLNLVVVDAAKSTVESVSFFGVLQRLYTLFSSSPQRWEIFKENVPQLTLKAISSTRWECRVESVKVLRYQLPGVEKALLSLIEHATKKGARVNTHTHTHTIILYKYCYFRPQVTVRQHLQPVALNGRS